MTESDSEVESILTKAPASRQPSTSAAAAAGITQRHTRSASGAASAQRGQKRQADFPVHLSSVDEDALQPRTKVPRSESVPGIAPGAVPPAVPEPLPPGVMPSVPAAMVQRQPATFAGSVPKYGHSSVYPIGVVPVSLDVKANRGQTLLVDLHRCICTHPRNVSVNDKHGITLMTDIHIETGSGRATRSTERSASLTRLLPNGARLVYHVFSWSAAIPMGRFVETKNPLYFNDVGPIHCNIAERLQSTGTFSGEMANRMPMSLSDRLERCDMAAVFMVLHVFRDLYRVLAAMDVVPNVDEVDSTIATVDTAAADGQDILAAAALGTAISKGFLAVHSTQVTAQHLLICRIMAAGMAAITLPAGNHGVPIHLAFRLPRLAMLFYGRGQLGVQAFPAMAVPSDYDFVSLGLYLVQAWCAEDDNVRGYMSAQLLLNVRVHCQPRTEAQAPQLAQALAALAAAEPDSPVAEVAQERVNRLGEYCIFTSSLECAGFSLPLPLCQNFMWFQLGIAVRMAPPRLRPESDAILTFSSNHAVLVGGLMACLYATGMSTFLHMLNMTGVQVSQWVGGTYNAATQQLDAILRKQLGNIAYAHRAVACNFTASCTPWAFDATCLIGGVFNGGRRSAAVAMHGGAWPTRVPYIIDPLCMFFCYTSLPETFGYGFPGTSFQLDAAVLLSKLAAGEDRGLYVYNGAAEYLTRLNTSEECLYIPYGCLLMTSIRQQDWLNGAVALTWIRLGLATGVIAAVNFTPVVDAALYGYEVGTFLSYDWTRECIVGPIALHASFDAAAWNIIVPRHYVVVGDQGLFTDQSRFIPATRRGRRPGPVLINLQHATYEMLPPNNPEN